ncbi:hypothetical protein SeMB42_g07339, partial [Synchytrium endobioticum]
MIKGSRSIAKPTVSYTSAFYSRSIINSNQRSLAYIKPIAAPYRPTGIRIIKMSSSRTAPDASATSRTPSPLPGNKADADTNSTTFTTLPTSTTNSHDSRNTSTDVESRIDGSAKEGQQGPDMVAKGQWGTTQKYKTEQEAYGESAKGNSAGDVTEVGPDGKRFPRAPSEHGVELPRNNDGADLDPTDILREKSSRNTKNQASHVVYSFFISSSLMSLERNHAMSMNSRPRNFVSCGQHSSTSGSSGRVMACDRRLVASPLPDDEPSDELTRTTAIWASSLSSSSSSPTSTPTPTPPTTLKDNYWTKRILSQDVLRTAATLSLMIAVFNVLLQWMHLLQTAGTNYYSPSNLLMNAWYIVALGLAIMTLRMATITSNHIATAMAIYVAVTIILMPRIDVSGGANGGCPFLVTYGSANVLLDATSPTSISASHSHNSPMDSTARYNPIWRTYQPPPWWYYSLNLPVMPLFWLSLGGLFFSVERLLYQHTDNSECRDALHSPPPRLDHSLRLSSNSTHSSFRTGSVSSKTNGTNSSTVTGPARRTSSRQEDKSDRILLNSVQHDTLVIQRDIQQNLAAMSALIKHIRRHQQTSSTSAKNSEPNIADALTTCIANLSYVVTQFQPIDTFLEAEQSNAHAGNPSTAASEQPLVAGGRKTSTSSARTRVLFDPCDLTEQVADAVAYYADSKEVELIVHTPVGRATEWYLTHDDPIPIRGVLMKILSEVLVKAEVNSHVSFNLNTDLPTGTQRPPTTAHRTYTMHCIWQIIYTCSQADPLEIEFCSKTRDFLRESGATHYHTSNSDV